MDKVRTIAAAFLFVFLGTGAFLLAVRPATASLGDCGQPISDGPQAVATDALFVLGVAIGLNACEPCVCDVDGSGGPSPVAATDALLMLAKIVGQGVQFTCPSCAASCSSSDAPECGGTCEDGEVCATDPFSPTQCSCLNACEASAAPACGGSCDGEDEEAVCTRIGVDAGDGFEDNCACLPADAAVCEGAGAPDCSGICNPATECISDEGSCMCAAQPIQGGCGQATAPECGGTCPDGFICRDISDGCGCVQFDGGDDTCSDAEAPSCGGSCGDGETCTIGFFGECECFDPCELSAAPACGGSCNDETEICERRSVKIDGFSLEFCECVDAASNIQR